MTIMNGKRFIIVALRAVTVSTFEVRRNYLSFLSSRFADGRRYRGLSAITGRICVCMCVCAHHWCVCVCVHITCERVCVWCACCAPTGQGRGGGTPLLGHQWVQLVTHRSSRLGEAFLLRGSTCIIKNCKRLQNGKWSERFDSLGLRGSVVRW